MKFQAHDMITHRSKLYKVISLGQGHREGWVCAAKMTDDGLGIKYWIHGSACASANPPEKEKMARPEVGDLVMFVNTGDPNLDQ